jgi:hypothetical protein
VAVHLGVQAFWSKRPGSPGSGGASPYRAGVNKDLCSQSFVTALDFANLWKAWRAYSFLGLQSGACFYPFSSSLRTNVKLFIKNCIGYHLRANV